jgi:RHS repeat-associated protein
VTAMPHLPEMRWDAEDRLSAVDLQGGGTAFYVYAGNGQRVRKVIERNGATVEEQLSLGEYEVYRRRQNGVVVSERVSLHVMDGDERIALVETQTVDDQVPVAEPEALIRFQFDDPLRSVTLEVDDAAKVISYEEYHPYGSSAFQATDQVREVPAKRYRYVGKERDLEHGLSYHDARYYAPWLARWVSADPSGLGDGVNVYTYARLSPIDRADPHGRQSRRITMESEVVIVNDAGRITMAQKTRREGVLDPSGQVKLGKETKRDLTKSERDRAQGRADALRKEMREKVEAEKREQEAKQAQEKARAYKEDKSYKLVVAVNVSSTDKKGAVQSSGNPGHTFVAIKDPDGKIVKILSYGPEKAFGMSNIACSGPGTTSYHLLKNDDFNTYEWDVTHEQSDKALKKIEELEKSPGTYSAKHQCTTVALEVTDAAGLSTVPRGKGNINVPLCDNAVDVSTPYHLNKELQDAKVPYKTQKGSDFADHGIPVQ